MTTQNTVKVGASLPAVIELTRDRVDSRLMAQHLGNQHKAVMALIDRYADKFKGYGQLPFKKEVGERHQGGGNAERFVTLKARLVHAFSAARRAAEVRQTEYLPNHHALHDAIKIKANGSPNEHWMHANANKVLNQLAGVKAGQRSGANPLQQSLLAVGAAMATNAVLGAQDGHGLHQRIKAALEPLARGLALTEAS